MLLHAMKQSGYVTIYIYSRAMNIYIGTLLNELNSILKMWLYMSILKYKVIMLKKEKKHT